MKRQIDGAGRYVSKLPQLNVKKLIECWEWVDYKNGMGGEPLWEQSLWATHTISTDEEERVSTLMDMADQGNTTGAQAIEDGYCGSAFCVSGYAARDFTSFDKDSGQMILNDEIVLDDGTSIQTGNDWEYVGRKILGLTANEASDLFDGGNTKNDIQSIMNDILESRGEEIRV